jgi:Rps23 Pro-64 3,4-dihydroxylase Tpa1-like proline 4-hydroxylase
MTQYSIKPEDLLALGDRLHTEYVNGDPYPHIIIDDFFPEEIVSQVLSEFPSPDDLDWIEYKRPNEDKLASPSEQHLSPSARRLIWEMNSQIFLMFLERLTGISCLIPDPQLHGGGMHQIQRGGKLGIHVDFNKHGSNGLDRRLNVLLYLNKDWKDEYGGQLELWDKDMRHCVKRIAPTFNRLVVFSTTESSWHGHPDQLTCPAERTRKSLALYYYTNGRPESESALEHDTVFRTRPGESRPRDQQPLRLRDFVPPVVLRWFSQ